MFFVLFFFLIIQYPHCANVLIYERHSEIHLEHFSTFHCKENGKSSAFVFRFVRWYVCFVAPAINWTLMREQPSKRWVRRWRKFECIFQTIMANKNNHNDPPNDVWKVLVQLAMCGSFWEYHQTFLVETLIVYFPQITAKCKAVKPEAGCSIIDFLYSTEGEGKGCY